MGENPLFMEVLRMLKVKVKVTRPVSVVVNRLLVAMLVSKQEARWSNFDKNGRDGNLEFRQTSIDTSFDNDKRFFPQDLVRTS
jgi:hypothetical protein